VLLEVAAEVAHVRGVQSHLYGQLLLGEPGAGRGHLQHIEVPPGVELPQIVRQPRELRVLDVRLGLNDPAPRHQ
jgi:hypothetical protein